MRPKNVLVVDCYPAFRPAPFKRRLLRPMTLEQAIEIANRRMPTDSFEQLTLADAGLEDEVRELLSNTKTPPTGSLP